MTEHVYIYHPALPDDCKIELDPAHNFRNVSATHLLNACGLIPHWIIAFVAEHPDSDRPLQDVVDEEYGFGLYEFDSMDINDDMELVSLTYPDDEPFKPFLKVSFKGAHLIQYDCGMLAFVSPAGELFVTRAD